MIMASEAEKEIAPKPLKLAKSIKLFHEAIKLLPAGVSSNVRVWKSTCPSYMPCSIYMRKAKGAHVWDVDGNRYIDYNLAYGPVILGHAYPAVTKSVDAAQQKGSVYGFSNELEIKVAKAIRRAVPFAEMMRFSNSGTEATMHALRIARAFTKRDIVVKFEGHYHGAHDYLLWSLPTDKTRKSAAKPFSQTPVAASLGIPEGMRQFVITERWNDFQAIENIFRKFGDRIAAVITEPIMGNAAAIMPRPGYLKHLRRLCTQYGALLIFDEVKTGFRVGIGGAQKAFNVKPDISCFAKSLSNGYPFSAIAGRREVMELVGPGSVLHGGTYAGNPVSLAAADATLKEFTRKKVFTHLISYGTKLVKGIAEITKDLGVAATIQGFPTIFQILFTDKQIWDYRGLSVADYNLYSRLHYEIMREGVMIHEDNEEVWFTSYSHKKEELEKTLAAFETALRRALTPRSLAVISHEKER
jgi:glutamate-1-semialdehyde 2,1-aminomutase